MDRWACGLGQAGSKLEIYKINMNDGRLRRKSRTRIFANHLFQSEALATLSLKVCRQRCIRRSQQNDCCRRPRSLAIRKLVFGESFRRVEGLASGLEDACIRCNPEAIAAMCNPSSLNWCRSWYSLRPRALSAAHWQRRVASR